MTENILFKENKTLPEVRWERNEKAEISKAEFYETPRSQEAQRLVCPAKRQA